MVDTIERRAVEMEIEVTVISREFHDLLRFDEDGLIADFTVMLRPLSGLVPFAQAMGEKLTAAGLQTTRV